MNASEYINAVNTFDPLRKKDLRYFQALTEKYPYFQPAFIHYLKAVEEQRPEQYENLLRFVAGMTHDRSLLYKWINSESLIEPKRTKREKDRIHLGVNPDEEKREEDADEHRTVKPINDTISEKEFKQPFEMRFSDWVRYIGKKQPIANPLKEKADLIDAFLASNPKIKPELQKGDSIDLSESSWEPSHELMTETLAKILVKQKKYDKALKAYQILSLKYPKKNSFFAGCIKEIKKLRE